MNEFTRENRLSILTIEGEDTWQRLKTHVEWCDHFALGFVFTAHPQVVHLFRERLADISKSRVTRLRMFDFHDQSPEGLVELFFKLKLCIIAISHPCGLMSAAMPHPRHGRRLAVSSLPGSTSNGNVYAKPCSNL